MAYGIETIAYYLPKRTISAEELAASLNFDVDFIRRKLGVREIFVADPAEQTSDLAVKAIAKLAAQVPDLTRRVEALVVCTQTPDYQLPHVSALVQDRAGLPASTAAFDINLGCSGWVYGLSVLEGFLERNGLDAGLLVTADTYSRIIDERDRNTKCLFSDAAAATFVTRAGAVVPLQYTFGTAGSKFDHLIVRGSDTPRGGCQPLFMDGRGIFEFVAELVPRDVAVCLERNRLTMADIDLFIFHQASNFILDTLAKQLRIPGDPRVVKCLDRFGNTVSSSIPIALKESLQQAPGRPLMILVSGFGVGLSWASGILNVKEGHDV